MSIKCPTCKIDNKDGAKFCKECGCSFVSLISCPACSALIKPGRFCASCGHSFAAPAPKAAEIAASETSIPKPEEQTTAVPIDISLMDIAEPVQLPAPIKDDSSAVVQPTPAPMAQVPMATLARTDDTSGVEISPPSAAQPPHKAPFKIAYALVPLAVVVALGGAYWWKSNHAETATAPVLAAITAPVVTTPENPVTPTPVPAPEPNATPAVAPEPLPVAKTAPVVPTPKQEPAKVPATTVKPVAAEKSSVAEKPAAPRPPVPTPGAASTTGNALSAPRAQVVNTAIPAKSLDETYNERITAECPQGFFPGMVCRENVRWKMCEGKWSPDALPGQTTCKGTGTK